MIKSLKKFYLFNKEMLMIYVLLTFSIFVSGSIINPILIDSYNFSENILSFSNIFLSLGAFISTLYNRKIFEYKINYFYHLKITILSMILLFCIFLIYIPLNLFINSINYQYLIYIIRFIEGFFAIQAFFIINYLLNYKILKNEFKGTINSLLSTKYNIFKIIAPIVGGFLITYTFNLSMYIISIIILFTVYIFIFVKSKKLLREYHRYILKKHPIKRKVPKYKKINIKEIFKINFIKSFFEKDTKNKIILYSNFGFYQLTRSFFDFYLLMIIIYVYELSLIKGTFLLSILLFSQIIVTMSVGYIFDRFFKNKKNLQSYLYTISLVIPFVLYILLYEYKYLFDNEQIFIILMILIFIHGFSRSVQADYMYRKTMLIALKENNYENTKAINLIISEKFNILGYIISGIILLKYNYVSILYYNLILSIIILFINLSIKNTKEINEN